MVKVDVEEVMNRLDDAQMEDKVCLLHPQEAGELLDHVNLLDKKHSRAEWIYIVMYFVVFWSVWFFGCGGRLVPPQ